MSAFDWAESTRILNLERRGIDFRDAVEVFDRSRLARASPRGGEHRRVSLGVIGRAIVAVFRTDRDVAIRIILARAARRDEREIDTDRFAPRRWRGSTDHARIAALTDADIAAAVTGDPGAAPLDSDGSSAAVVIPAREIPVSVRLDADVLAYLREDGAGYLSRINAVLRSHTRVQPVRG